MKLAMGVLLLVSAYLVWRLHAEMDTTRGMQAEMQGLRSKLYERSRMENVALQAQCADQAEKVFQSMGYKRWSSPDSVDSPAMLPQSRQRVVFRSPSD